MLKFSFQENLPVKSDAIVICHWHNSKLSFMANQLDGQMGNAMEKIIGNNKFDGSEEKHISFLSPNTLGHGNIILFGLGDKNKVNHLKSEELGGKIYAAVSALDKIHKLVLIMPDVMPKNISLSDLAAHIAHGIDLSSYRFNKYFTDKKKQKIDLEHVTVVTNKLAEVKKLYESLSHITQGVFTARNLISEPANVLYPKTMEDFCYSLKDLGIVVESLNEEAMRKLNMGALLGVAQGSAKEPRLITLEWRGNEEEDEVQVAFVGKGVTFDTGGISLKPPARMDEMKYDMAGSAALVGLLQTLALRKAKVNVVAVLGMAENMPDGNAQRPGDVVTTMSGKTVEVLNTDAEGRLVLCDALWYCQDLYHPKTIIDIATLTGAIIVALGNEYAGLFSNSDQLAKNLLATGEKIGEKLWRMPLCEGFDKLMNSKIADVQNIASEPVAGSSMGAQFLQRFIKPGVNWAHLDIAGMDFNKKPSSLVPAGASAFGVRLFNKFIADHYESK